MFIISGKNSFALNFNKNWVYFFVLQDFCFINIYFLRGFQQLNVWKIEFKETKKKDPSRLNFFLQIYGTIFTTQDTQNLSSVLV